MCRARAEEQGREAIERPDIVHNRPGQIQTAQERSLLGFFTPGQDAHTAPALHSACQPMPDRIGPIQMLAQGCN